MIRRILRRFRTALCGRPCPPRVVFAVGPFREQRRPPRKTPRFQWRIYTRTIDMAVQMTISQFTTIRIKGFVDKRGNPVGVDTGTPPAWATDNSDVLALEPAADGMSCKVAAVGMVGAGKVQVVVDAAPGEPVALIMGVAEFEVTPGQATVVQLDVDPPAEQP